MKINLQNIKLFWKKLREHWSNRFLVIVRNEKNLSIVFSLKLTPRKMFVLGTTTFLFIIMLTAMLIAFTSLRVYVPGYTNPVEYHLYRKMLTRVDSIERINAMQKVYLDNFYNVLNDIIVVEEMDVPVEGVSEKRVKDQGKAEQAKKQVDDVAEQLLIEVTDRSVKNYIPLSQYITSPTFAFTMPALGIITKPFSIEHRHFGIDIENEKGTLITAIADGVVISTHFSEKEGNILVIQHSGNMVSLYKNVDMFFKNTGTKVKAGEPVATMGNRGTESQRPYLHFEIWYNGSPIDPLNYFVGN
ncbi:MAG: M23 family metallopeptidase [Bacteroidetes bacterium]|nr:M23 family metallopeptidase [Bacteroidota bacterium]MCL2302374.1 M23 family metallopeptidase [Lentimicrobiaceae bacterium]